MVALLSSWSDRLDAVISPEHPAYEDVQRSDSTSSRLLKSFQRVEFQLLWQGGASLDDGFVSGWSDADGARFVRQVVISVDDNPYMLACCLVPTTMVDLIEQLAAKPDVPLGAYVFGKGWTRGAFDFASVSLDDGWVSAYPQLWPWQGLALPARRSAFHRDGEVLLLEVFLR